MNFIGQQAIDFTSSAVMPNGDIIDNFNLKDYIKNSYGILFFYPLDFTFVCPTEILSFSNKVESFANMKTKIIGVSVDSQFSHFAWMNKPVNEGGINGIKYPLVSDITKNIARQYGVLINEAVALRATIIIDDQFNVRTYHVNDLPIGRNVDEYTRLIKAIQHNNKYGEVCPANWDGGQAMHPSQDGLEEYISSVKK